tara:strand:+ start:706 stop:3897 length:3192 start_codon:yes stop_codon:yes gene_type:complete
MPTTRTFNRSFAGGELSPEMFGRIDDTKFQSGAAKLRNFIALPQGPAVNRPGTTFVREVKFSTKKTRLIPFTYSTTQTMVLEFGDGYIRFHTQGSTLLAGTGAAYSGATPYVVGDMVSYGGSNYYCILASTGNLPTNATYWFLISSPAYEIPSPYLEADLFDIHHVQSVDVLTIVHPNYAPRELRRLGATQWTLVKIPFVPFVTTPTSVAITPSFGERFDIVSISRANPGSIVCSSDHQFVKGDSVYISNVGGMTELETGFYVVNTEGSAALTVKDYTTGEPVDTSSFTAYTSGGKIEYGTKIFDIVNSYVVTAIGDNGIDESLASTSVSATNNLYVNGAFNTITWSSVVGAIRYNIYKIQSGLYGYIGQTETLSFTDDNIAPDMGITTPIYDTTFYENGIVSVPVTNGGTGYATTSTGGSFSAVTVTFGGSGYTTPTLTVADPTGTGAVFTVTLSATAIITIGVTNGGSGYTAPIFVLADGGAGPVTKAVLKPVLSAVVKDAVVLGVTDSTGTGAVLSAEINDGVITKINVTSPGKNYTAPVVTVTSAAGGSAAAFGTPVLSGYNYPGAVSYFEQRRVFAGTTNSPQQLWMTRSGTESDMSYRLPVKDDDRISFKVSAREANTIRHIVPLQQLMLLTSTAEWRVSPVNSDAITPTTISVRPQSYIGANNVQPSIVNNSMVYCAARGGHVRELGYSWQSNGYITGDLSLRAAHLFDNYDIVDMCYSKSPHPLIWFVSSTGLLLGLTYVPEQQIGAWHQHDTDGLFESCTSVAEGNEDHVYVVVQRTINGNSVRYVERMASNAFDDLEDCFFVDSGLTYDGANTTATTVTVTGGTVWGPTELLTITASTPIFAFPALTDIGDAFVFTATDGTQYRLTIEGCSSTTVVTARSDKVLAVPFRNVPISNGEFARNSVGGLSHLEGKTVSILADGAVMPSKVVVGGSVSIDRAAVKIHVGLQYFSDLQTLPLSLNIDAFGQGRVKNINQAWVRVFQSSGLFVGPTADKLTEAKMRTTEPYGSPPALRSDEINVNITPTWAQSGQIYIRQADPLPLTIVGVTIEAVVGG